MIKKQLTSLVLLLSCTASTLPASLPFALSTLTHTCTENFNRMPEWAKCAALATTSLFALHAVSKTYDWSIKKGDDALAYLGLREEKELPATIPGAAFFEVREMLHYEEPKNQQYVVQFYNTQNSVWCNPSTSYAYKRRPSTKELKRLEGCIDPNTRKLSFKSAYIHDWLKWGNGMALSVNEKITVHDISDNIDAYGYSQVVWLRQYPDSADIKTNCDVYPKSIFDTLEKVEKEPPLAWYNCINFLFWPYIAETITYDNNGMHRGIHPLSIVDEGLKLSVKIACLSASIAFIRSVSKQTSP